MIKTVELLWPDKQNCKKLTKTVKLLATDKKVCQKLMKTVNKYLVNRAVKNLCKLLRLFGPISRVVRN